MSQTTVLRILAATGLLISSLPSEANLISNGSFETGIPNSSQLNAVDTTSIPGWTVANGNIDRLSATVWQPSDGNWSIDLNGVIAGTLSQSFATIAGLRYTVTFYIAGNPFASTSPILKEMQVSAGADSGSYSFNVTGHTGTSMGWQHMLFEFAATGPVSTLAFTSLITGNGGVALDNVQVTANVPEPGTALLMLTGLLTIAPRRSRRENVQHCTG